MDSTRALEEEKRNGARMVNDLQGTPHPELNSPIPNPLRMQGIQRELLAKNEAYRKLENDLNHLRKEIQELRVCLVCRLMLVNFHPLLWHCVQCILFHPPH